MNNYPNEDFPKLDLSKYGLHFENGQFYHSDGLTVLYDGIETSDGLDSRIVWTLSNDRFDIIIRDDPDTVLDYLKLRYRKKQIGYILKEN